MIELAQQLSEQLAALSWLELIAVVLALAYVWLAARQNIWCWPCAFVSTGIYIWLFWQVSLPFHTLLNVYYLMMAVYGWSKWQGVDQMSIKVTVWPLSKHILWIAVLAIIALFMGALGSSILDSDFIYLDAYITVFSVFTTILVAHKVLQNWLYWIVINSFASYLYFSKDLALTGCLFIVYVVFAVYGYQRWRKFV
jgi:nicotinamide mononucleotide transporter